MLIQGSSAIPSVGTLKRVGVRCQMGYDYSWRNQRWLGGRVGQNRILISDGELLVHRASALSLGTLILLAFERSQRQRESLGVFLIDKKDTKTLPFPPTKAFLRMYLSFPLPKDDDDLLQRIKPFSKKCFVESLQKRV